MFPEIERTLQNEGIVFEKNVELRTKTWIHRGGKCLLFIEPKSKKELQFVASLLVNKCIKFRIFGETSNVYIRNESNIDVVVSILKCNKYVINEPAIECEPGVRVVHLARAALKLGIEGFECLTALPGTVAGALVNNSSCEHNSISKLLISATVINEKGEVEIWHYEDFAFDFRTSTIKRKERKVCIVGVVLNLRFGDLEELKRIEKQCRKRRAMRVEGYSNNLGCTVNATRPISIWYRFLLRLCGCILRLLLTKPEDRGRKTIEYMCFLSGYKDITQYISHKNPIIYMWLDEGADLCFPRYLSFMNKVYGCGKTEIELI